MQVQARAMLHQPDQPQHHATSASHPLQPRPTLKLCLQARLLLLSGLLFVFRRLQLPPPRNSLLKPLP
ncbi:hypothetical protein MRX96_002234 [Rhipicephalus microplus]